MIQEKTTVLWNKRIGSSYFQMGLKCNKGFSNAMPGQFVMLRPSDQADPLLRRPFSIYKLIKKNDRVHGIEILYKVIGKGTVLLSMCHENDLIDILGPLGNSFLIPQDDEKVFLVAGGIGVPPIVFLASHMKEAGINLSHCSVFLGGRTTDDLLCMDRFKRLKITTHISTDDGSEGQKGYVTHSLEGEINKSTPDVIYACGPLAMLKQVIQVAEKNRIKCYVSIETMMACGLGACVGCVVESSNRSGSYFHACKDGPVFNAADIQL